MCGSFDISFHRLANLSDACRLVFNVGTARSVTFTSPCKQLREQLKFFLRKTYYFTFRLVLGSRARYGDNFCVLLVASSGYLRALGGGGSQIIRRRLLGQGSGIVAVAVGASSGYGIAIIISVLTCAFVCTIRAPLAGCAMPSASAEET